MQGAGKVTTSLDVTYRKEGEEKVFHWTNTKTMAEDLTLICVLFLIRGSTFEKYKKKSNKGLDDLTGILAVKYNIDTNLRPANASVDPDLITIPRLIACFPMQACELLQEGIGRALITAADLSYKESEGVPACLLSSHFIGVLPFTESIGGKNIHHTVSMLMC